MRCRIRAARLGIAVGLLLGAGGPVAPAQESAAPRERVEQMTPELREQLFRKQQRFEALSAEEQDRLRRLHEQLVAQPDRQALQGVMERYHAWLAELSPLERRQLENMPPRERLSAIEGMRARQLQNQRPFRLPPEDREKVTKFLRRRIDSGWWYESSWLEQWDRRRRMPEALARQITPREEPDEPPPPPRGDGRRGPRRPDPDFFRDMDALFQELTPETRAQVEGLSPRQKIDAMRGWLRQGMRDMAPSEQELEVFFTNELTDERREQLLELAPDEMLHELRRLYVQKQRPPRGGEFRGGPPRGGDDRGPRRRRGDGPDDGPPPGGRPPDDGPGPGEGPPRRPPEEPPSAAPGAGPQSPTQ